MRPRFAILGPLRVDAVAPSAAKHRSLLGALVLAGPDGMTLTRLIDVLWDEEPPATARKALQVYVSELRRVHGADVIVTRPSGYVIGPGAAISRGSRRSSRGPPASRRPWPPTRCVRARPVPGRAAGRRSALRSRRR